MSPRNHVRKTLGTSSPAMTSPARETSARNRRSRLPPLRQRPQLPAPAEHRRAWPARRRDGVGGARPPRRRTCFRPSEQPRSRAASNSPRATGRQRRCRARRAGRAGRSRRCPPRRAARSPRQRRSGTRARARASRHRSRRPRQRSANRSTGPAAAALAGAGHRSVSPRGGVDSPRFSGQQTHLICT